MKPRQSTTTLLCTYQLKKGQVHAVRFLLDRGAIIDAKNVHQSTPLHIACRFGHMEVITQLVDGDASLDAVDDNQHNCLLCAAFFDHLDVCLYFIDIKGFDPAVLDSDGKFALSHSGCFFGQEETIIAHGDDRRTDLEGSTSHANEWAPSRPVQHRVTVQDRNRQASQQDRF